MLESEVIKQLAKSVKTFDNTKTVLEDEEKKGLNKLLDGALRKAEGALDKLISNSSEISDVTFEIINGELLSETLDLDSCLMRDIMINSHLTSMIVENATVRKISSIITEEIDDSETLSEKEKTTFLEVLDQMFNAFSKSLSRDFGYQSKLEIQSKDESATLESGNMLQMAFSLKIENTDATVYYLMSYDFINELIGCLMNNEGDSSSQNDELEESVATVQPIKFEEFADAIISSEKENMELLMDLQLQVSVELGKVKKPIKEILQFTQGTIVELDRLAGENVDVLVSGKIIAKGEVVVVDQNFGVRITQIVLPEKRV